MFGLNNIFAIKYPFFIMPVNEIKKDFSEIRKASL